MKLKRFLLPILAWSGLMLTSCHCEHEEDDGLLSSLQVGNVVCSDGNILSMDKFKQSDKEAVAIVFHVNRSAEADNLGYAKGLWSICRLSKKTSFPPFAGRKEVSIR